MNHIMDFLLIGPIVIVAWTLCAFFVFNMVRMIYDIYKRGW
jgi:hypothetical protein